MPPLGKPHNAQTATSNVVADIRRTLELTPHPLALIGIGAIAGTIYVLYLFPLNFLAGTSPFWQGPPIADLATEIAGIRYYLGDAWLFPLFRTVKIAPPDGTSIIYM